MGWKRKIKDGPRFWFQWFGVLCTEMERIGRSRFRGGAGRIEFGLVCVKCELLIKQLSGKVQGMLGYIIILGILDIGVHFRGSRLVM